MYGINRLNSLPRLALVAALATTAFAVFAFSALVSTAAFAGPEEDMLKSLEAVKKLEKSAATKTDFLNLSSRYREIITRFQGKALDPTLAVLHYRLSCILLDELGDSDAGIKELSKVVELYPNSPESTMAIGALYRFFDDLVPERAGMSRAEGGPGFFVDRESGVSFGYDASAWKPSKGALPAGTLLDLVPADSGSKRRLSVICNASSGLGIMAFASAFVDEMKSLPGVTAVTALSSRSQFLGSLAAVVSKLKVVSDDGASILFQAVVRGGERTLCILMVDDFSKTVQASLDFNALLDTVRVR